MKFKDKRGFSVIELLTAIGILAFISLIFGNLFDDIGVAKEISSNERKFNSFKLEINKILNNEDDCRVSLAGDGDTGYPVIPLTFNKIDMDDPNVEAGIEIKLYQSSKDGLTQATLKFEDNLDFQGIHINTIRLFMPNNPGANYPTMPMQQTDMGELLIDMQMNRASDSSKVLARIISFPLRLFLSTDSSNVTTIYACSPIKHVNYELLCNGQAKTYNPTGDPQCI